MTTATATTAAPAAKSPAVTPPGLTRLTAVELRKMTDTRAGFWLQLTVAGLTILTAVIAALTGDGADHTLRGVLGNAVQPAAVLLPVMGVLLVASEWSQRTAQITFTLVPQRSRILLAKTTAGVVLGLASFAFALVVSAAVIAVTSPDVAHPWTLPLGMVVQNAVFVVTSVVIGVGFGAAILSPAPAIVLNFVLPIAWTALASIHAIESSARWLDQARSLSPLTEHLLSGTDWARAGTTLAVWMVIPLGVGAWRIARAEIS
jgi:ABC-2 type transport system permease protein